MDEDDIRLFLKRQMFTEKMTIDHKMEFYLQLIFQHICRVFFFLCV